MALYELNDTTAMIAKRITSAMGSLVLSTNSHDDTCRLQGLGLALAFVFEESAGESSKQRKPSELMKWAIELPDPVVKRVRLT